MSRALRPALLGLLLATLAAWWAIDAQHSGFLSPGATQATGQPGDGQLQTTASSADPANRPDAAFVPRASPPGLAALEASLPEAATPPAVASAAWWQAARAGSGEAAWRLVEANATCAQRQDAIDILLSFRGRPVSAGKHLDRVEEFLVLAEEYCKGSEGDPAAALREALWLGVEAGDVRALATYLMTPPLPRERAIALADELLRYREYAPRIAQWLLAQGYADLPYELAIAYDGLSEAEVEYTPRYHSLRPLPDAPATPPRERTQPPLGQVLPDDPAQAWRYARLCMRVGTEWMRARCTEIARVNGRELSRAQRDELQAWVDAWREGESVSWLPRRGLEGFLL